MGWRSSLNNTRRIDMSATRSIVTETKDEMRSGLSNPIGELVRRVSPQSRAIELAMLTDKQLKVYLSNCMKRGEIDLTRAIVSHMFSRGIANGTHLTVFEWNQDSVRSRMRWFKEIASEVKDNQRTAYTEAGGFKIGRAKGDPDKKWIDTYCAIKTSAMNAVFVCYVKMPGDEPEFELQVNDTRVRSYNADQLDEALEDWTAIGSLVQ
jgi:hypothetical protein